MQSIVKMNEELKIRLFYVLSITAKWQISFL